MYADSKGVGFMNEVNEINVATFAAVISAFAALVAAWCSYKQNNNLQLQINLSLYDRRFKIYTNLMKLIYSVASVELPIDSSNQVRFVNEISNSLQLFWRESKEKDFLLDDELNEYIKSVESKIRDFLKKATEKSPPEGGQFAAWLSNMQSEQAIFLKVHSETHERFKKCLNFKNISESLCRRLLRRVGRHLLKWIHWEKV